MSIFKLMPRRDDFRCDLIAPFQLTMSEGNFIKTETKELYKNLLIECYNKSTGLDDKKSLAMWDNFERFNDKTTAGFIGMVAEAMANKTTAYIVYDKTTNVIRKATSDEQAQIRKDYQEKTKSDVGIMANFTRYDKTDVIKLYYALLYNVVDGLNISINVTKAIKYMASLLREKTNKASSEDIIKQAKEIVNNLKEGNPVLIDSEDKLESGTVDVKPVESAVDFICGRIAGELRVSLSYVNGKMTSGISSTGEADEQANERGIEIIFNSIYKPLVDSLFNVNVQFQSDNYHRLSAYSKILPIIESSDIIDDEQKDEFVKEMFNIKGEAENDKLMASERVR